jgi:hypothetical protein
VLSSSLKPTSAPLLHLLSDACPGHLVFSSDFVDCKPDDDERRANHAPEVTTQEEAGLVLPVLPYVLLSGSER